MNPNVWWMLVYTAVQGLATGIWSYAILAPYLSSLEHNDNSRVGLAEAIQGICVVVAALPAGCVADAKRVRRATVVAVGGAVGVLAMALTMCTLLWFPHKFTWLCVSMGMIGAYQGLVSAAMRSLFVESIPVADRSYWLSVRYVVALVARCAGPTINVILFSVLGNEWSFDTMTNVFATGIALHALSTLACTRFSDDDACRVAAADDASGGGGGGGSVVLLPDEPPPPANAPAPSVKRAVLVTVSEFTFGVASGMTVKFFPIFFEREVRMSPVALNALYVLTALLVALGTVASQRLSTRFQRAHIAIACNACGMTLMFTMALWTTSWRHPVRIAVVYAARTAFYNAPVALIDSILQDSVDSTHRAKWTSLESVTSVGWSGSAWLGGYLLDTHGFATTFFVTAILQTAANVPLLFV
jgi:predicted MFS family arabinose efflux permease